MTNSDLAVAPSIYNIEPKNAHFRVVRKKITFFVFFFQKCLVNQKSFTYFALKSMRGTIRSLNWNKLL